MTEIDDTTDTHVAVVKPVDYKGSTRKIRHYYCTIECLLESASQ